MLVGDDAHARPQHVVAGDRACRPAAPVQRMRAVGRRARTARRAPATAWSARASISPASAFCAARAAAPWLPSPRPTASGANVKPSSRPIGVAFDHDFAGLADFGFERRVLAQPPHQHAGAAIDEALGQPLVQRIGELVLDAARDACQCSGIGEPVGTVGREGPGPDMRDAVGERIDIAIGAVGLRDLARRTSRPGFYPPASGNHRGSTASSACVAGAILR